MANWATVDLKRGIYIDMDIVGAIGTYEQKRADGDNWIVGFFSKEDVNNELACGRFPDSESALECARMAYLVASNPLLAYTIKSKEFKHGEAKESGSGTVRGEGWETRRSGESKSS